MWNRNLPRVRPYYAVKCNTDPILLGWLSDNGAAFDCASSQEMMMVSGLYEKPVGRNVLFANPCKTPQDIAIAKELGVPWVTVDSVEELVKMRNADYTPELLIRLKVDDVGSTSPFSAKFGATSDVAKDIYVAAAELRMGPVVGISFHIGSGSDRPEAYSDAITLSYKVWNSISHTPMKVIDLGGGWSSKEELFIEQTAAARTSIRGVQRVIAEPGRFFAAPVYSLYVRVIGKKPGAHGWRYTLDESIYGQFSCVPYDHATPEMGLLGATMQSRKSSKAILFGRTCDSLDWIANANANCELMPELFIGDWLYFPNMGAYTTSTSTEFNGFPKPEVIKTNDVPEDVSWLSVTYPLSKMLSLP